MNPYKSPEFGILGPVRGPWGLVESQNLLFCRCLIAGTKMSVSSFSGTLLESKEDAVEDGIIKYAEYTLIDGDMEF